jgi:Transglycosylase SLT domain
MLCLTPVVNRHVLRMVRPFRSSNSGARDWPVRGGATVAFGFLFVIFCSCAGNTQPTDLIGVDPQQQDGSDLAPTRPRGSGTCEILQAAAAANEVPLGFFARLIWQESRFDQWAIGRAGAQGVAQFMPETAQDRRLDNPFDPVDSLAKSAKLLRDLKAQFGNFGLAAAAYNAGPKRVRAWLAGTRQLPRETLAYVRIVTGRAARDWATAHAALDPSLPEVPCPEFAKAENNGPVLRSESQRKPEGKWFVQLFGDRSEAKVLSDYHRFQERHSGLLREARAIVARTTRSGGVAVWHRLRILEPERSAAENLCSKLRSLRETCIVQRN